MSGIELDLNGDASLRMLGRGVDVIERKTCCMSTTKSAVAIFAVEVVRYVR